MSAKSPNWGTPPWTISFRAKQTFSRWDRLQPVRPPHVDFAVIGAGFSGLAAAAYLARLAPQKSVVVLESGSLGAGASGHTGGMALAETAAGPLPGLGDVLRGYKKILRDLRVSADLHLPGVWEIARSTRSMDGKTLRPLPLPKKDSLIDWSDSGRLRPVKKVPGGTVNPGKILSGLARAAEKAGVFIFEQTAAVRLELGGPIKLQVIHKGQKSVITADHVLLATNAASLALLPELYPGESPEPKLTFALATAPLTKRQIAALGLSSSRPFYTVDLPYLWGRLLPTNKDFARIIFGSGLVPGWGESLPDSKKLWLGLENFNVRRGQPADRLRTLETRVRNLHPALKNVCITHRWAGPILLTEEARPIFRHHPKSKNVIILAGFNGHGVALSVYLAKWAAQSLLGKRPLPTWSPRTKPRKPILR
jgi:gamma-glutamylputrescine oxidase